MNSKPKEYRARVVEHCAKYTLFELGERSVLLDEVINRRESVQVNIDIDTVTTTNPILNDIIYIYEANH